MSGFGTPISHGQLAWLAGDILMGIDTPIEVSFGDISVENIKQQCVQHLNLRGIHYDPTLVDNVIINNTDDQGTYQAIDYIDGYDSYESLQNEPQKYISPIDPIDQIDQIDQKLIKITRRLATMIISSE